MVTKKSRYCTGPDCLCTREFAEADDHWVCLYCQKKLFKVTNSEGNRAR